MKRLTNAVLSASIVLAIFVGMLCFTGWVDQATYFEALGVPQDALSYTKFELALHGWAAAPTSLLIAFAALVITLILRDFASVEDLSNTGSSPSRLRVLLASISKHTRENRTFYFFVLAPLLFFFVLSWYINFHSESAQKRADVFKSGLCIQAEVTFQDLSARGGFSIASGCVIGIHSGFLLLKEIEGRQLLDSNIWIPEESIIRMRTHQMLRDSAIPASGRQPGDK